MALNAGTRLGPYEVLSPIGAGGMGEVYRARDTRLGREVAIKVLPASFSNDADRLRRFEQEAKAAGLLNHPNITAVYDIGSHEGAPYVVTELLEGETLRAALSGGRLSPRKATDYALQMAHGLAAAHEKGIVHRDLKPENLFVTRDGRLKILDFGLAKLTLAEEGSNVTNLPTAAAGTEPGVVLGTLGYMSPEQVRGRSADARSDIFSFGAILYEMLSGKRAFHGDSAADTMSAILREDPPELSATNQNVSPGLERIIHHCLEKNPEQRFHSAHDIAFAFEALSGASGASVAPSGIGAARGRRRGWSLTAAVILAIAAAAAGFLGGKRSGPRRSTPVFQRLTYRHGFINSARFAPDGQTIVYSAAWDGKPADLFTTRAGAAESRSLSLSDADVQAVSSAGELAILMHRPFGAPDMLARVPLAGGTPREIGANVVAADWGPDGKSLAIIRSLPDGSRALEFPISKVLDRAPNLGTLRVSPKGDAVAVTEAVGDVNILAIVDLSGRKRKLADVSGLSLAWTPAGDEIWFTGVASSDDKSPSVCGVDLGGHVRSIFRSPGVPLILDIASDGRVLLSHFSWRAGLHWSRPGETAAQDVSWLDWSISDDLSDDGKSLLFTENRDGGKGGAIFLRRDPAEPPVRLGQGTALALSPDGAWVLASERGKSQEPARLQLLPSGAGEARTLPTRTLTEFRGGRFLADGKRVVFGAAEPGKQRRLFITDTQGGKPRPITPEGASSAMAVSPDGKLVATRLADKLQIYPVDGGQPRILPGQEAGEIPIVWAPDGRSLYVFRPAFPPVRVSRVDVETGRRDFWKEIMPADLAGLRRVTHFRMTPDTRSFVYNTERTFSDLYVVAGLR